MSIQNTNYISYMITTPIFNLGTLIKTFVLGGIILGVLFLAAPNAYAATVELTVNGGSSAAVTNGQSVLLEWYIDGAVSSCVINNGVGPISTSVLPATGSLSVIPPDGATTDYSLTCSGGSSVVTVAINPEVTITVLNPTEELDRITGEAQLAVEWTSRYATQCSPVWLEYSSNPGVQLWTVDTSSNNDIYETAGNVFFEEGNSQPAITEDATFYIECENVVTGTRTTVSAGVTVTNPVPLPAPTVDIFSRMPGGATVIERDSITALAEVSLGYDSDYIDECSFEAYYLDGTPYVDLPEDFDAYGLTTDEPAGIFWWIGIYESTRFEITCTQFAYSLGGTNYPEVSVTDDIIIQVNPPLPLDRTGLPQVTVTATALENPVDMIPGINQGQVAVRVVSENAEGCRYSAWGTWGSSADGWWGQNNSGDKDEVVVVNLYGPGTTTLYATCERTFDTTNFSPGDPEYDAAIASTELAVVVIDTGLSRENPTARIYGNAAYFDLDYIWSNSTAGSGFGYNAGGGTIDPSLRGPNGGGGSNFTVNSSITFPFTSPDQVTDSYDLQVKYCDENDGFNDYTLTTEGGQSFSWRSDSVYQPEGWCSGDSSEITRLLGTGVTLTDGELITITCNNTADPIKNEQCTVMGLAVGQGDGGSLEYELDSVTGFASVPLYWASEQTEDCYDPIATTQGGTTYEYSFDTPKDLFLTADISTTTTFSISCDRSTGETDTSSIQIQIPSGEVVTATTSIDSFECYDPALPGVRDTEVWEWANPNNSNFCEPAVDLNVLPPSISFADAIADNIAGLYDSLEALIVIENLGPGPLLSGNEIEFLARLQIDFVISTLFSMAGTLDSDSTPGFVSGLAQPPEGGDPTVSPVLTRTYNGVPFGEHQLCARVNLDGTDGLIFTEWNADVTNNLVCTNVVLPVPPPPMTLSASRDIIRLGQTVDITWEAHTSYPLNCVAIGPGGINNSFDASSNSPNPASFIQTTNPLTSTSKFRLTCTEPITNTVFTEELTVEVVPESEEV